MKLRHVAVVVCFALGLSACAGLPAAPSGDQQQRQAQALVDSLAQTRQEIARLQEERAAATQPIVITPATATQPAVVIAPPPELVKAAAKIEKPLQQADAAAAVLEKGAQAATRPGADPIRIVIDTGQAASQSGLIPAPYAQELSLGFAVAGFLYGLFKKKDAADAKAATQSVTNAVQAGISAGKITVGPGAVDIVDAAVSGHRSTDAIVDVIGAAQGIYKT